jgi:hypothetical protein
MPFFLKPYLTEFDESLSGDSYIDPIGTLIIWSAFGRQIFSNRINSVSNDVRNYTVNLFHHFLIRKLARDDGVVLSHSLQKKYQDKDNLHFKQACLIFLENLFVYSMLRHENEQSLNTAGILGISKARRGWEKDHGAPTLKFTHEASGQILVRQLGLGVSGRYKSPLMNIGFFDASYNYNKPAFELHWTAAEQFIIDGEAQLLSQLAAEVYPFLKQCVTSQKHGGTIAFSTEVQQSLTLANARAFASPALVGSYARDFWLEQTGLDTGSAGALLRALEDEPEEQMAPQDILERALQSPLDATDKAKLQEITQIEPFLSDCALLFNLMAAERTHTVADVVSQWKRFGRDKTRLGHLAEGVMAHAALPAVRGTEAAQRLTQLQQMANASSVEQQIHMLSAYHTRIMRKRGQVAWLSIHDNTIKVHARTLSRPEPEAWPPGAWYNAYYLPQFKNFVDGLQGVTI